MEPRVIMGHQAARHGTVATKVGIPAKPVLIGAKATRTRRPIRHPVNEDIIDRIEKSQNPLKSIIMTTFHRSNLPPTSQKESLPLHHLRGDKRVAVKRIRNPNEGEEDIASRPDLLLRLLIRHRLHCKQTGG